VKVAKAQSNVVYFDNEVITPKQTVYKRLIKMMTTATKPSKVFYFNDAALAKMIGRTGEAVKVKNKTSPC